MPVLGETSMCTRGKLKVYAQGVPPKFLASRTKGPFIFNVNYSEWEVTKSGGVDLFSE